MRYLDLLVFIGEHITQSRERVDISHQSAAYQASDCTAAIAFDGDQGVIHRHGSREAHSHALVIVDYCVDVVACVCLSVAVV